MGTPNPFVGCVRFLSSFSHRFTTLRPRKGAMIRVMSDPQGLPNTKEVASLPLNVTRVGTGRRLVMSDSLKVLLGVLGGVIVLLLLGVFYGGGMGGMDSMMSGGMMGYGIFGMLFLLLFWVLRIALIAALVVWILGQSPRR